MVVPNSNGFTLYSIDTSDISSYTSKLLLQHKSPKYAYLFDRLTMVCPELKLMVDFIKTISDGFYRKFRGRVVAFIMKLLVVYSANPQRYHYSGDYIMASNYSQLKYLFQRLVKMLIKVYGYEKRLYHFHIKKKNLIYISKLFANDMIDECIGLVPRYEKLMVRQNDSSRIKSGSEVSYEVGINTVAKIKRIGNV